AVPGILGCVGYGSETLIHLAVDLLYHGDQQTHFVAEVMVKRATRQTRAGGEILHRGIRVAPLAKARARRRQQRDAGLFHLGASASNHPLSPLPTCCMIIYKQYV